MPVNAELQEQGRRVWGAGNWDEVADYVRQVGEPLLDALDAEAGMRLLDVGAGSGGSIAIPAAKRGLSVVASDLVAAHFEAGRRRAAEADVEIEWVEADALDLPFEDGEFDRVLSTFGHMFAPDHALAASEMVRVTKPGGKIGLAAWTPEGTTGQMFRLTDSHMPPPPEGFQPPPLWGTEDHVRELMEPLGVELSFEQKVNDFREESPEVYREVFETNFGPMVKAREALGDKWTALKYELDEFFDSVNEADDGTILVRGEYLEVVGRRT